MAQISTLLSPASLTNKNKQNLSIKNDPDRESVLNSSFAVANYYISYHLRNSCIHESLRGLPTPYLIPPAQPSDICTHVAKVCTKMEQESFSFFDGLPQRMKLRPDNAKSTFMSLSQRVLSDKGLNWGRIMSVYTLGGAFAVHFVNKGHLNIVQKIPFWIEEVAGKHLVDWIIKEGGWDSIQKKDTKGWSPYVVAGAIGAVGIVLLGFRN